MESVVNAVVVYCFLLIVFRFAGRRTLAKMTTFDLLLVLMISEATQGALIGEDRSFTNAALVIITLVGVDIALSYVKLSSKTAEKWLDGTPMVIVANGEALHPRMKRSRVDVDDVLTAARESRGLPNMNAIAYAVLENNGGISIIPAGPSAYAVKTDDSAS